MVRPRYRSHLDTRYGLAYSVVTAAGVTGSRGRVSHVADGTIHHRHLVERDGNEKPRRVHAVDSLDRGSVAYSLAGLRARRLAKRTGGTVRRVHVDRYAVNRGDESATIFDIVACPAERCRPIR